MSWPLKADKKAAVVPRTGGTMSAVPADACEKYGCFADTMTVKAVAPPFSDIDA
jgi:hypothetical protein